MKSIHERSGPTTQALTLRTRANRRSHPLTTSAKKPRAHLSPEAIESRMVPSVTRSSLSSGEPDVAGMACWPEATSTTRCNGSRRGIPTRELILTAALASLTLLASTGTLAAQRPVRGAPSGGGGGFSAAPHRGPSGGSFARPRPTTPTVSRHSPTTPGRSGPSAGTKVTKPSGQPKLAKPSAGAKLSSGVTGAASRPNLRTDSGKATLAKLPGSLPAPKGTSQKDVARADYARHFGTELSRGGLSYKGFGHRHWTRRHFNHRWRCHCWFCPCTRGWYYWCGARDCFLPVSYLAEFPPEPDPDGTVVPPDCVDVPVEEEQES